MTEQIKITMEALKKNRIKPFYAQTKEDIMPIIKSLIGKGETIAVGGSVTLDQIGAIEEFRNGDYAFIDRYKEGITLEERKKLFRDAFFADNFVTSSNAVTENGELVNVDGNANRVAAMLYGPESVIVVVGKNKIVKDTAAGFERIRKIAAPKNVQRLNCKTYCAKAGECKGNGNIGSGCFSEQRICCDYVVSSYQRFENRIKVIICAEDLGY